MISNTHITGITPFMSISTFICDGLSIPRGMFLGGCFYTAQEYLAPLHISYINCATPEYLSTWGIADVTGKELAIIYFTEGSLLGNIKGLDGQYAGCLKARKYNYNNNAVIPSENPTVTSDLSTFLKGLSRNYTLDADTLMWDVNYCSMLAVNQTACPSIRQIVLPDDCTLAQDTQGAYYMAPTSTPTGTTALQRLIIGNIILSGAHVCILPYCVSGGSVVSNVLVSGAFYSGGVVRGKAEDTLGSVVDGGIVIATHGAMQK